VLARVRHVFDLACDPGEIARALGPLAAGAEGLRLPGAFDGFELAVRAVLGQQVTVKAAHTLAGRLVAALGEPLPEPTPWAEVHRLFPTPQRLAATPVEALAALGLVRSRAAALVALAQAVAAGRLDLGPAADLGASLAALRALPGIGPWTAQYIALRALGWPDAWPSGDVALVKALGAANAAAADARAEAWRPWRGYATVHLWRRLAEGRPAFGPDAAVGGENTNGSAGTANVASAERARAGVDRHAPLAAPTPCDTPVTADDTAVKTDSTTDSDSASSAHADALRPASAEAPTLAVPNEVRR
jgi:AraC family transcriptional regulator of adaptative response / DNA-3-methyladenine glycosylase II